MRRIYIHLLAIVIASFAAWLTWELVLRDEVTKPAPAPAQGSSDSGSSGSGSSGSGSASR